MNQIDMTKEELLNEIQKLKEEIHLLKTTYNKEISEYKKNQERHFLNESNLEALRKSEEKYKTLFQNSAMAVGLRSPDGRFLEFNNAYCEMLGYSVGELKKLTPKDLTHPDDYKITHTNLRQISEGESETRHYEKRYIHKTGKIIWADVCIQPLKASDGSIEAIIGTVYNITERKKAEEALKQSEERFRTVLENLSNVAVQAYTLDGTITFWNDTSEFFYGYSKEEVIGKSIYEVFYPEPEEQAIQRQVLESASNTGNLPLTNNVDIATNFNRKISIISNRILIEKSNKEKEIFSFDIDITERKKVEEELVKLNEELENRVQQRTFELQHTLEKLQESNIELKTLNDQVVEDSNRILILNDELLDSQERLKDALASKDRFFSIIAHDLRNPFVALLNLTELLSKYYDKMEEDERIKMLFQINNTSKNTFDLLENLLQWARSQMGSIEFAPQIVNLYEISMKTKMMLMPQAELKGISLKIDIPPDTNILCDSDMTIAIIRNLVSNSIKFTPRGGKIGIGLIERKNVYNIEHCLYVKDNGIGMNSETLNKLFRLDQKVSRIGTEGELSTGLGLILCKEFIEKHNGKIWVESEVGKGTTFYFTLNKGIYE